jgi:putative ATPase
MQLATLLRPTILADIVGQDHLVGKKGIIYTFVANKKLPNIVLWGPPGIGKTTLARVLANTLDYSFYELSAVSTGKDHIETIVKDAKEQLLGLIPKRTLVFLDEIHRWNKAQQDALLPHLESGLITLIGATTENPSFTVNSALLSRSVVYKLEPLTQTHQEVLILRGLQKLKESGKTARINAEAQVELIALSGGDGRTLLNALELAVASSTGTITTKHIRSIFQDKNTLLYDKQGEEHYNTISAFIKSMRGNNTTAALYYMHRMLQAGEDPLFIARRMIIFASEDIGMADRSAIIVANAAYECIQKIGMPEANYTLTHACMYISNCAKSRSVADTLKQTQALIKQFPRSSIPLHLRNAPTKLMKDMGYGKEYSWEQGNVGPKNNSFLPKEVQDSIKNNT